MTKYRIIEFRQRNGVVYYSVQKSFLYFFWVYITEIRDISMASYRKTYKTFEEAKRSNLNPLRIHNETTGAFEPMTENTNLNSSVLNFLGVNTSVFWFWNVNDWGENTGKYFGSRGGSYQNGYQIFTERRQIQFTGSLAGSDAVLMYVSNGQSVDNASQIPWDSFSTIQAYGDWKSSPNAAFKDSPEARTYYNERRLLRANLNNLTEKDIIEIVRNGFTAAIKN